MNKEFPESHVPPRQKMAELGTASLGHANPPLLEANDLLVEETPLDSVRMVGHSENGRTTASPARFALLARNGDQPNQTPGKTDRNRYPPLSVAILGNTKRDLASPKRAMLSRFLNLSGRPCSSKIRMPSPKSSKRWSAKSAITGRRARCGSSYETSGMAALKRMRSPSNTRSRDGGAGLCRLSGYGRRRTH